MCVIGIDPGIGSIGYAVISKKPSICLLASGTIKTAARAPLAERLFDLSEKLSAVIENYNIDAAAIEKLFFTKNVKTAIDVSHARGVIMLEFARRQIEIFEYTPLQIKMALTGYGQAEKRQVKIMVMRMLGMKKPLTPDDTADAAACALCHSGASSVLIKLQKLHGSTAYPAIKN
ncbi:MAG: crossover junction endodeoxyribonuclease RuvC [Spirochaetes bacterium GWF1_41_5]|nr:MAG: crossover junction endodeoxyribonuclease RuvC [Spirochaetes bacterium GWF1_41_5]HBE01199.1 crossover junction endodeoxyribonuclease RuvC [Spirochaetia bacterium]